MTLTIADIWEEWKRLTRFLECSKIAFKRESDIWRSLQVPDFAGIRITTTNGDSSFSLTANDHLNTLQDEGLLYLIVLAYSYSLCECYARVKMGLGEGDRLSSGIETWGTDLLTHAGNKWDDVLDGRAGLIEVAVARNFIAHGSRLVGQSTLNRFNSAGESCPWVLGQSIVLDYEKVELYRSRLKSLMRLANP
jgi:hypothetical protein